MRLMVFGLGYAGRAIADLFTTLGWEVISTGGEGLLRFDDVGSVRLALADAAAIVSTVPPDGTGADPVIDDYGDLLTGKWLGYLSSTGVYGDTGGAWVDESAPVGLGRRTARSEAEAAWLDRGARVFRLPGIYGRGRSVFDRILDGRARRIDAAGQVFSRVHVADIAEGVRRGLEAAPGAYNLADDLPASQSELIEHACRLIGRDPPPILSLDEAELSPQARAFYSENRRVANGKAKRVLGWRPRYPTYVEGLAALRPR